MMFITALSMMILIVGFMFGVCYWTRFFFKRISPDFQYWLKYKVLKQKYNPEDVKSLDECLEKKMDDVEITRFFLMKGLTPKKVEELLYIYYDIKKLKGGKII